MTRHVRLRELLVGIEGLALLRHLYDGTDADAERRIAEIRRLLDDDEFAAGETTTEASARAGYDAWSENYDQPGNPIVALEESVVWALLAAVPPGRALDAACGTGRHSRWLLDRGHSVVGVDLSPGMLAQAAAKLPAARFVESDLAALPLESGTFDVAVSGLALAHVSDLRPTMRELARVLRPGGQAVLSILHPFQAHLGWHAPFADSEGRRGFVREHPHTHADYLTAFRQAGLEVVDCQEPPLTETEIKSKRRATTHIPEATKAAYEDLPAVLIWHVKKP